MLDPTSQANYLEITTEHVSFDWHVDFQQKTITGSAVHNLILMQDGVSEVV
jgi:leukotriene-A4 hydrolase